MINLPRSDNFDEVLPSGSSYMHGNWLRLMPFSVQQKIVASNNTNYFVDSGVGTLHDGYFGAPRAYGGPYAFASDGVGLQGAAYYGTDVSPVYQGDYLYCSLFRQSELILNGRCQASFQLHEYSGPAQTNNGVLYASIVGRWSGATIDETPATLGGANFDEATVCGLERHEDGSGYMALIAQNLVTPTQRHIFILRVNNGIATVLADTRIAGAGSPFSQYFANARILQMEVTGTTTVTITVKSIGNANIFGASSPSAPTETVLTVNDSSVNRIASPGRWGFGASASRTVGAGQVTTLIHGWRLWKDPTGNPGVVPWTYEEDWTRDPNVRIHAYKTPADPATVTGRNLHSRYYGDIYSSNNILLVNSLIGIVANKLVYQAGTNVLPLADQIPEASDAASRRSITATFTAPALGQSRTMCVGARLKARASYALNEYPYSDCFLAILSVFNIGGALPYFWQISVSPVNASGSVVPSSTITQSWSTATVGPYGTQFNVPITLDIECFNSGTSNDPTFRVVINGTVVNSFSTANNWTSLAANYWKYTAASAAQKVGKTWGFGAPNTTSTMDDWQLLSLSGGQQEAQIAHQLVYVAAGQATQARIAHQVVYVAADQDKQARIAHQLVYVAHRTATGTNILSTGSGVLAFQAGAATISSTLSLSAIGAQFFFFAGAATLKVTQETIIVRAEAAGDVVNCGTETATIASAGSEAGQTTT